MSKRLKRERVDVDVSSHGSVFLFQPLTARASDWIEDHVQAESWQWFGGALAVDHHYARQLADAMVGDGMVVR